MSYLADEMYEVYEERQVRARKDHACSACGERVSEGHLYTSIFAAWSDGYDHIKRCLRCQALHEHLRYLCWGAVEFWPDERLQCGESYRDEWGEDPPEEIQALAFVTPEEMQERV